MTSTALSAKKTLATKSLTSFPGRQYSGVLSQPVAGGIKCIQCDSTGKELLEASPWFPPDFAP